MAAITLLSFERRPIRTQDLRPLAGTRVGKCMLGEVTLESRHAWKTDFVSGVMQNGRDTYLHQESIDVKDRGVPDDSIGLTSCKAV